MKTLLLMFFLAVSAGSAQVVLQNSVQVGGTSTGCPTSGCTLTGPLNGTSATFSGTVAVGTRVLKN